MTLERAKRGLVPFFKDSDRDKAVLAQQVVYGMQAWVELYGDFPITDSKPSVSQPEVAKIYPEISLPEEHQRQSLILAELYAKRLNMSPEEYIATLPQFPEKPEDYDRLGLTVPLLVETRISWPESARLSGIFITENLSHFASKREIVDWEGDQFEMPTKPFGVWVQNGSQFVYEKPSDVRVRLKQPENEAYRAGRILDGIALWNQRPDMVNKMYYDLIGTAVGSDSWPYLDRWGGRPGLDFASFDFAVLEGRALVLGREVRTVEKGQVTDNGNYINFMIKAKREALAKDPRSLTLREYVTAWFLPQDR